MESPSNYNRRSPRISAKYIRSQAKNNFLDEGTANQRIQVAELWRTVRKRWLAASAVAAALLTCVAVSALRERPTYQSQTVILVDNDDTASEEVQAAATQASSGVVRLPQRNITTEIQVLKSSALIGNALNSMKDSKNKLPVEEVASRVSIQQIKDANVLIVSYTDTDPQRVQAILQSLGSGYVNYSLESRRSRATNAIKFIEEQLPQAKWALSQSGISIQEFRKRYGFVDPEAYAIAVVSAKQDLEKQAYAAAIALEVTNRQYQEIMRQMAQVGLNPRTALTNSMLTQDEGYQQLVKRLQDIDLTYAQESLRFKDTYPGLQDLRINRTKILNLLQQRAQMILKQSLPETDLMNGAISSSGNSMAQILTAQLLQAQTALVTQTTQLQSIRQVQGEMNKQFQQIPSLQQTYTELERQYQMNSQEVNSFLQKLQELRIKQAEETAPWKILEPPYLPTNPIAPKVQQRLLLGLIGSCAIGVLVALLLEGLDTKIKNPEEVKALTGVPLLGTIPLMDLKEARNGYSKSKNGENWTISLFTEAIRSIALNLTYVIPKRGAKILAVTSAVPKEGKSTVTYHIGSALADLGYRVLIVDADMYRPTLHKQFNDGSSSREKPRLNNEVGLSTAIATERSWRNLIHVGKHENFHILTSGPKPPSSFALLNSEKMTLLINEWSQNYDYVLIDTPPVVGVTDAQSLANKVDGVLLVVSMTQPSRVVVSRAMEILQSTRCNIAGLAINMVDRDQQGYYYQYYQSYYADNGNGAVSQTTIQPPQYSNGDRT